MKAPKALVAPRENPLMPFATMRRIYAGMVESRMLEARLTRERGEGKRSPFEGQEACRAAVLAAVEADDLSCDVPGAVSSKWLRGAELGKILRSETSLGAGSIEPPIPAMSGLLPPMQDRRQRFGVALGAALTIKQAKLPRTVVGFLDVAEAKSAFWDGIRCAARYELPMLFVVLPEQGGNLKEASSFGISTKATRLGVPGITVDAGDAVAIFRVAQESLLRARASGGAALMECVPLPPLLDRKGAKRRQADPIAAFGETLLRTGACDQAWLTEVASTFKARLGSIRSRSAS